MNENIEKYQLTNEIPIYVEKNDSGLNFDRIIKIIRNSIPETVIPDTIQSIMIGNFDWMKQKTAIGSYSEGVIYIDKSVLSKSEDDVIKSIIHEMAHAIEKDNDDDAFNSRAIQEEFLNKRTMLFKQLQQEIRINQNTASMFSNLQYDAVFDSFLLNTVGYTRINELSKKYMIDPYAFTDLHEYIAKNFENYFLGNDQIVKEKGPAIYEYINGLF